MVNRGVCQLVKVASIYWLPMLYLDGLGVLTAKFCAFLHAFKCLTAFDFRGSVFFVWTALESGGSTPGPHFKLTLGACFSRQPLHPFNSAGRSGLVVA